MQLGANDLKGKENKCSYCFRSGSVLMSGSHDGTVSFWDISNKEMFAGLDSEPVLPPFVNYTAHADTVNSIRSNIFGVFKFTETLKSSR